jgi:hypothetical protein
MSYTDIRGGLRGFAKSIVGLGPRTVQVIVAARGHEDRTSR